MMRKLIILALSIFPLFVFAQDEQEKERIQVLRQTLREIERNDVDAVTDFDGKTEDDEWEPENIVYQYNYRIQQQEHIHDEYREDRKP